MSPFVLSVLKYALLALLYFFIYRAVRSVAAGLSARPAPAASSASEARGRPGRGRAPTVLVVHAPEERRPRTYRLSGPLEIGRAETCQVRLEDTYASLHHARLSSRDGVWLIEDLGSTNGTYVNERRISGPVEVHVGDVVRIGKTALELRR